MTLCVSVILTRGQVGVGTYCYGKIDDASMVRVIEKEIIELEEAELGGLYTSLAMCVIFCVSNHCLHGNHLPTSPPPTSFPSHLPSSFQ